MATRFRSLAETFTLQSPHFHALYLPDHGVRKFTMVIMLTRRILWAYPVAMVILAGFLVYQSYEFVTHGPPVLLLAALFDAVMIVLVCREWNLLKFQSHDLAATPGLRLTAQARRPALSIQRRVSRLRQFRNDFGQIEL